MLLSYCTDRGTEVQFPCIGVQISTVTNRLEQNGGGGRGNRRKSCSWKNKTKSDARSSFYKNGLRSVNLNRGKKFNFTFPNPSWKIFLFYFYWFYTIVWTGCFFFSLFVKKKSELSYSSKCSFFALNFFF